MQTRFTLAQLADPDVKDANAILRACVHCGFCTATCPTYVLLGDELDGPRGRIYLIKEMFERYEPATPTVVKHIDRCLSCLACMTTCPSGVNYMHLVDHGRRHIARTYRRPLLDRSMRRALAVVLPRPGLFRWALLAARLARPVRALLPAPMQAMLKLAPSVARQSAGIAPRNGWARDPRLSRLSRSRRWLSSAPVCGELGSACRRPSSSGYARTRAPVTTLWPNIFRPAWPTRHWSSAQPITPHRCCRQSRPPPA